MKNYFNKALLYREWRNIRVLSLAFCVQLAIMFIIPFTELIKYIRDLEEHSEEYNLIKFHVIRWFNNEGRLIALIITVIFLATLIVSYDLIGNRYNDLNSMPFNREEIIVSKSFMGIIAVIIPIIITHVIIYLFYYSNKYLMGKYFTSRMILTWIIIDVLVTMFVLIFIMLIQCLSSICMVGGIVGAIFLILPMGVGSLFMGILSLLREAGIINVFRLLEDKIFNVLYCLTPVIYGFNIKFEDDKIQGFYIPIKFRIIVFSSLIIITFILMVYSFKKTPLDRLGYVVIFRPLETIFKVGVSICFGLLGANITQFVLDEMNNINKILTITVLMGILCGWSVYVITSKVIESNKK